MGSEQVVNVTDEWWPVSAKLDVSDLAFSGTGDFEGVGLTDASLIWFEGRQDGWQLVLPGADIGPPGAELGKSNTVLHYGQDTAPPPRCSPASWETWTQTAETTCGWARGLSLRASSAPS